MSFTYFFYDLETTGRHPCFSQSIQFAGLRFKNSKETERHEFTIRLNCDVTPNPEAMKIHGIPLEKIASGLKEIDAMQTIHQCLTTPNTINLGYNNLSFDDEFLRFSFHRNLLPPYLHQFSNGCYRMDLYPITALYFLIKPNVVEWPITEGRVSLKLEDLNHANSFVKGASHQAMVDVEVTVALAQRFATEQKIWNYLSGYFVKSIDLKRLENLPNEPGGFKLALLASGRFSSDRNFLIPALFLGQHAIYKNQFLWLKLDAINFSQQDHHELTNLNFIVKKKLGEPPLILPYEERFLKKMNQDSLCLARSNYHWLITRPDLIDKIREHHRNTAYPTIPNIDPDAALYQIPFPTSEENNLFQTFHRATALNKSKIIPQLKHSFRREQAVRILGRHYPEALTEEQKEHFNHYLQHRRHQGLIDYKGALIRDLDD